MDCDALRDDQWERLKEFVPGGRKGKRGPRTDNRRSRTRSYGWRVRALAGATYRSSLATTKPSSDATIDGSRWGFWTAFSRRWRARPIWNG